MTAGDLVEVGDLGFRLAGERLTRQWREGFQISAEFHERDFSILLNLAQELFSNAHISHFAKLPFNPPVDIREIRQANLRTLIAEFGTKVSLANAVGTPAAYISQIISKKTKRQVGDALARRLEEAAGKPRGWMDHPHGHAVEEAAAKYKIKTGVGASKDVEILVEKYLLLSPKERTQIQAVVDAIASTKRDKKRTGT